MDIQGKTIWQVAAGDMDRHYVDLCLDWGVILNGPGEEGPWPDCEPAFRDGWQMSSRKISDLRRFAEDIKDGDVIVLRMGTTDVYGVGIVVGEYLFHEEFGDVDGWGLEHVRRVRWVWRYDESPKKFPTYSLKFGDTVQLLNAGVVSDWIADLRIDEEAFTSEIPKLPEPSSDIALEAISEYLFDHGVASTAIQDLATEIGELERIAKWYQKTQSPSESETVAYLVIPLLRALGWTPQRMAVEWNQVDLALFRSLPRTDEKLSIVVEAKYKDKACLNAKSQAQYYAEQPGRENCQRLIVTDGIRYGIYLREKGVFSDLPAAYLNLTRMRKAYPLLKCGGADLALLMMAADWSH